MKKIIACGLVLASLMGAVSTAHGAEGGFTDVPQTAWYYDSVTAMSAEGLLLGVGDGSFAPDSTMTRAAYVTIAVRAAYGDELKNTVTDGGNWWDAAYAVAQNHGIISASDPDFMSEPSGEIRREEMALILQRTAHAKGIATTDWVYQTQIPDFGSVSPYCRDSVRECYTLGILNGVNSSGRFKPQGTLDRASASQSFYKLLNADKRTPVTPQKPSQAGREFGKPAAELQTWVEGEPHTPAQAGDTVIKADGTQVVLTMNRVGDSELYLLGFGQGVDIITGTMPNPNSDATWGVGYGAWYDDDGTVFKKYDVTGEVYTTQQWLHISSALLSQTEGKVGTTDGEMLGDYFHWNAFLGRWLFHFNYKK